MYKRQDNTRVLHLDRWQPVNARQKRILTYLMQFNLSVKFVRGCNNYTADALSRLTEDMAPVERKAWIVEQQRSLL